MQTIVVILVAFVREFALSRATLQLENIALRQQVAVLNRERRKPSGRYRSAVSKELMPNFSRPSSSSIQVQDRHDHLTPVPRTECVFIFLVLGQPLRQVFCRCTAVLIDYCNGGEIGASVDEQSASIWLRETGSTEK